MKEQNPDQNSDDKRPTENERAGAALSNQHQERVEITQRVKTRRTRDQRTRDERMRDYPQPEKKRVVKERSKKESLPNKIAAFLRLVLLMAGILVCVALAAGVWAGMRIPQMAEEKFGPPAVGMDPLQRVLYSARLLASENSLLTPFDGEGKRRDFEVSLGETVNSVATRLEEERIIRNADALRTYLIYSGLDKGVQAGEYQLSPAMTTLQIAQALQDPTPAEVKFIILPGWRAEEIAAALPTSGLNITPEAFLQVVREPSADVLPAGFPLVDSLEGYLLPGQYQVDRKITAQGLAALFAGQFNRVVDADLRDAFTNQGLDLHEAVTLASIVQREAMVADEQPMIASVFYNRLQNGMKLDSDPTVQYALGYDASKQTWWKNPLSTQDLVEDSRYNTYIYAGLPPGPIANPGIEALQAVAYPAQTDYFYFRARCDGSGRHAFSVTYEEHLQNACP